MSGPLRPDWARSLRAALAMLAVLAAALTAVEVALVWSAPHLPFEWLLIAYPVQGLADVVIGAVAWDRRPANRTGALLCVLGLATLAAAAGNVTDPVLVAAGTMLAQLPIAVLLHLVLAFPSGRLRPRSQLLLVIAGYIITVGLEIPQYLFGPGASAFPGWDLQARPWLVTDSHRLQGWLGAAVLAAACVAKARQVRAERRHRPGRRHHLGVFAYGIATILFLPLTAQVVRPLAHLSVYSLFGLQLTAFFWVPVVFAAAVLRGGFSRTGNIEQLGAWLAPGTGASPQLRDALAETVGDPSLQLLRATPGDPLPAAPETGRGVVHLKGARGRLASVVYDQTLIADPALLTAAGGLVALALEREQLAADLLVSRQAVRESRARIVQVGDQQRRRLAQDLHDGLQNRLLLAALHAGQLAADSAAGASVRASAAELSSTLQQAINDLRRQLHGLMPALLIERGLPAAIEGLADQLPVPATVDLDDGGQPIPPAVATTGYFIVAEAFTNSLKHARASNLSVRLRRDGPLLRLTVSDDGIGGATPAGGAGLRGMADRVEALDGTLELRSPGTGTQITVTLPCVS